MKIMSSKHYIVLELIKDNERLMIDLISFHSNYKSDANKEYWHKWQWSPKNHALLGAYCDYL